MRSNASCSRWLKHPARQCFATAAAAAAAFPPHPLSFLSARSRVTFQVLGAISRDTLIADLYLAPVAVAGILTGIWLHRRIPAVWFFRVTYVLLAVTGTKLIWDGLA